MKRVLVLDEIHGDGLALLRARADVELTHLPRPDSATIAEAAAQAECLLLRGRTLDPTVWDAAQRLQMVSRHGVGCDNLPLDRLDSRGVTVAITANANAVSVAEHAMMLMLATARGLVASDAAVRAGDFARRETLRPVELSGATLLIVGLGRIGRAVAGRAAVFGMNVMGVDPLLPKGTSVPGVEMVGDLDTALGQADFVTLHLGLSPATQGLFDAARLARMKPDAILINTARGGIVDEPALIAALQNGALAAAGLDVFAREPVSIHDPVLSAPNLTVTPHDAAMTREGARRMAMHSAQNILDFLDGRLDPAARVIPRR